MNKSLWFLLALLLLASCNKTDDRLFKGEHFGILSLDSTRLSIDILASSLVVPWDLLIDHEGNLWFTQQKGTVSKLSLKSGKITELMALSDVHYQKSRGLLSMALHPEFDTSPIVFLHYNYLSLQEKDTLIKSRLVSYLYDKVSDQLQFHSTLVEAIPGKTYHNGSRMIISDDQKILLTTGDAGVKTNSQEIKSLSGKLLRINLDGSVPNDNPFPGSYIFAFGFRNSQGLVKGSRGQIYGSDHGPNNDDEINVLIGGANYGWPLVEGYCDLGAEKDTCENGTITEPIHTWTPTVAPAGIAYYDHDDIPEWKNSLLVATLKAQFLGVLHLNEVGNEVASSHVYLQRVLGRIRDVAVSASGEIYLSTSNHDWHPKSQPWMYDSFPAPIDDRIIRISRLTEKSTTTQIPQRLFEEVQVAQEFPSASAIAKGIPGKAIYEVKCANCHMKTGMGIPTLVPPLSNTDWVSGDKERLILSVLEGLSEEIVVDGEKYQQEMPGFKSQLDNQQMATVLTYIRSNFGNNAEAILPIEVAELRE